MEDTTTEKMVYEKTKRELMDDIQSSLDDLLDKVESKYSDTFLMLAFDELTNGIATSLKQKIVLLRKSIIKRQRENMENEINE